MNGEFGNADDGSWAVAGVMTDLQGAVLTSSVGDGGLAGAFDMAGPLFAAANDARFGHLEGEMG